MKGKVSGISNGEKDSCIILKRTKRVLEDLDKIFDLYDYLPVKERDLFIKDGIRFIFSGGYIYIIMQRDKNYKKIIKKIFDVFEVVEK
jgi:hypothetical protein